MAIKETHVTQARRPEDPDGIYERNCPQCGKIFTVWNPRVWAYRRNYRVFCSWKCYREDERGVRPHPGQKAAAAISEARLTRRNNQRCTDTSLAMKQTEEIIRRKERGMRNDEIAAELGLTPSVVAQRLTKYGRQLGWVPMTKKEAGLQGVKAKKKKGDS